MMIVGKVSNLEEAKEIESIVKHSVVGIRARTLGLKSKKVI